MNESGRSTAVASVPDPALTIEESDLVRLAGDRLFVHNSRRGLAVLDVTAPSQPTLLAAVPETAGSSGELYVRDERLVLLVVEPATACPQGGTSAILDFDQATTAPVAGEPICLPGEIIASRLVGDVLYVVDDDHFTYPNRTTLRSFALVAGAPLAPVEQLTVAGEGLELHVTDRTIYLTQRALTGLDATTVRTFDISAGDGSLVERGQVDVAGEPMGRFHMEESGDTFRIVTRNTGARGAILTVLDVANLDTPRVLSTLPSIAPDEVLFATRFVGDRAYIVTYLPELIVNSTQLWPGGDPLWVISLTDPSHPVVLGELEIPGWSDYLFPRGDLLLAVGRGASGNGIAASLFDVSDPTAPLELRRLEFGLPLASSEANTDFRGVTVVESALGAPPLLVVPYSDNVQTANGCRPEHHVQLVDVAERDLVLRAALDMSGRVRRTLPVGDHLYVVDERVVTAVGVADRDAPDAAARVPVGDLEGGEECIFPAPAPVDVIWRVEPAPEPGHQFPLPCDCSTSPRPSTCLGAWAPLWVLFALGAAMVRRRLRHGVARGREVVGPDPSATDSKRAGPRT